MSGTLEVERQKSNTPQPDVLRCNEFWRHLEHTRYPRGEEDLSQELEGMLLEENQPDSATACSGGMGTDVTPLIEGVEPSSFVAVGDRLDSSYSCSCGHNFFEKESRKNEF